MPLSEFILHRRVAFHEVDSAGIVHFSVYFRYMEEAEHAMWRQAGLSIAARGADVGFPRVSAGFDYHRPLRFEDEFAARIRIVAIGDKSMRYVCTLNKGAEKIATGTITVVCVTRGDDGVMKARSIPPEIAGRFAVSTEAEA
ncbi:MAG TPA: thioesterase family protein [Vicinamibacterales bacterium]|nr:thioesterase family protein [Vicinamibacterales bacterium]